MLAQRVLVVAVLLPIGLWVIAAGGVGYLILVALLLGLAGWEYVRLFRAGGFQPAGFLTVLGVIGLSVGRFFYVRAGDPFRGDTPTLSLLILLAMTVHLIAYERGRQFAGTDFAITLGGVLYIGFLGGYLIPLRALPDGKWWVLTVLPAVWLADSAAYFVGKSKGKRRFSPRLSPKKTWEGFLAGVVIGPLLTAAFALLWQRLAGEVIAVTPLRAGVLGFVLALLTPLGDLGESMLKRQVGVKDSSGLLPGHGGVLDRVDSWLWAAVIGYYLIPWLKTLG